MKLRNRRSLTLGPLVLVSSLLFLFLGSSQGLGALPPPQYSAPFAVLGEGSSGHFRWDALLYRHRGRPCLDITLETSGLALCEKPAPVLFPTTTSRRHGSSETLFAILTKPSVVRLTLDIAGRGKMHIGVVPVGQSKAREARLDPELRYAVAVVPGAVCVKRFVAFNQRGVSVFQSYEHMCG